eukprot:1983992-Rhodomonas_salina.1
MAMDDPDQCPFMRHSTLIREWLDCLQLRFGGRKPHRQVTGDIARLQQEGAAIPMPSRNVFKSLNVTHVARFSKWRERHRHPLYPKRIEIRSGAPPAIDSVVTIGVLGEAR